MDSAMIPPPMRGGAESGDNSNGPEGAALQALSRRGVRRARPQRIQLSFRAYVCARLSDTLLPQIRLHEVYIALGDFFVLEI